MTLKTTLGKWINNAPKLSFNQNLLILVQTVIMDLSSESAATLTLTSKFSKRSSMHLCQNLVWTSVMRILLVLMWSWSSDATTCPSQVKLNCSKAWLHEKVQAQTQILSHVFLLSLSATIKLSLFLVNWAENTLRKCVMWRRKTLASLCKCVALWPEQAMSDHACRLQYMHATLADMKSINWSTPRNITL